ncbi:GAF and ANTAR domain-containing protein [Actinoplanes sp. N902-109]|uniref:GAF and ANTAR domain-containing protein n=1 Tax=Actinoplanes sp. (strain N902-109) TaxID=649831 RepID=UPI0003293FF4|nr:GAF and ANTAR domain-containing protein [Actinoplanes sp. N902-109]AGL16762.1 response regulator receiver/ANTAR domain-containing protein [Actinoplanes sp. N902-109]
MALSGWPAPPEVPRPLAATLAQLAATPDDAPEVEPLLAAIAQLTADRVGPVDYASITMLQDEQHVTVAASSELARAVDAVQYEAGEGPCVQALAEAAPTVAPDLTTTMRWPAFAAAARRYGLTASMSAPLYTGSGECVAVLNMHGRDLDSMTPVIHGVWLIYHPSRPLVSSRQPSPPLDDGGQELLAGLSQAVAVRTVIQQAIHLVMARDDCSARDAYLRLLADAAATGQSLLGAAAHEAANEQRDGI